MSEFRKLPHMLQSHEKRNCGAACLAMLFQYHGKKGSVSEITKSVSGLLENGVPFCKIALIILAAFKRKYGCCCISAKDIRSFIPFCLDNGFEIMLLYHSNPRSTSGHFVLVSYCDEENVYVNNPDRPISSGRNQPLSFEFLMDSMSASRGGTEIKYDNTVMVFSPPNSNKDIHYVKYKKDGNVVEVPVFEIIYDKINGVVDPFNDAWLIFPKTVDLSQDIE